MNKQHSSIYGLVDPKTNELRYIDTTFQPLSKKLDELLRERDAYLAAWIRGLKNEGLKPEIFEIEKVHAGDDWREIEQFWIKYFSGIGANLLHGPHKRGKAA